MNTKLLAVILTTALTASGTTAFVMDSNTTTQPVDQYELDVRECMVYGMSLNTDAMSPDQLKSALPTMEIIVGQSVKDYVKQYGDLLGREAPARQKCESLILLRNETKKYLSEHK